MTFSMPAGEEARDLGGQLYAASLPAVSCNACGDRIARREHRVTLRASWRGGWEYLCPRCWQVIVGWASRFALRQLDLPI